MKNTIYAEVDALNICEKFKLRPLHGCSEEDTWKKYPLCCLGNLPNSVIKKIIRRKIQDYSINVSVK